MQAMAVAADGSNEAGTQKLLSENTSWPTLVRSLVMSCRAFFWSVERLLACHMGGGVKSKA